MVSQPENEPGAKRVFALLRKATTFLARQKLWFLSALGVAVVFWYFAGNK